MNRVQRIFPRRTAATRGHIFMLAAASTLFLADSRGSAQESAAANPSPIKSVPANSPAAALRDTLAAACTQNSADFSNLLTARSRESFARMTPAARVALMKRFVLLNEPGKATSSSNAAGRPLVRCETTSVTTEMSIGGAELRENVAFLPMELRSATDTDGSNVHVTHMGMLREGGQWRVLSLGLLLLDLPSLEVEWDAAEMDANENAALVAVRKLNSALETYRHTYANIPESLAVLGPPAGGAASREAAGLVDADLASGNANGYVFRIVIVGGSSAGEPAKYELAATPATYGRTGRKSFFRDVAGKIHAADRQGTIGNQTDEKIE